MGERGKAPVPALKGDTARRAFDTVAAAQKVKSASDLEGILRPTFSALGFDVFVGVDAVNVKRQRDVQVLFGQSHSDWEVRYQAEGHAHNDAVIRAMLNSTDPVFWSDLSRERAVSPAERRVLDEARQFRLCNGFMTPMHKLDGSISAVLLMGEHIDDRDPDTRAAAHLLSIYYGSIARRLHQVETAASVPRLSARQRECLNWVRAGKSSTDIGDILGLSSWTVDEHIAAACARLGVRTRVQAVAEAALHGLIEL
jgi:LuxR family transcriptional regulator, quorum-sensing system regulator BjaR1